MQAESMPRRWADDRTEAALRDLTRRVSALEQCEEKRKQDEWHKRHWREMWSLAI